MSRISQREDGDIAHISRLASGGLGDGGLILVRMKELMKRGESQKKAVRVRATNAKDDPPDYEDISPEKEIDVAATFTHGFYFEDDLVLVTRVGPNFEAVTNGWHKIVGTLNSPMSSGGSSTLDFMGETVDIEDDGGVIPSGFTLSGKVHGVTVDDKLVVEAGNCNNLTEV